MFFNVDHNVDAMGNLESFSGEISTHLPCRCPAEPILQSSIGLSVLLDDWDQVYDLSADWFEELVFNRLIAMGLQPIRLGAANRKDGGIDIIFWSCTVFPMLGAVQVKHHRMPERKTGSQEVRDLAAKMRSYHFNVGLVVTNTSFTPDAHFESEKSAAS